MSEPHRKPVEPPRAAVTTVTPEPRAPAPRPASARPAAVEKAAAKPTEKE